MWNRTVRVRAETQVDLQMMKLGSSVRIQAPWNSGTHFLPPVGLMPTASLRFKFIAEFRPPRTPWVLPSEWVGTRGPPHEKATATPHQTQRAEGSMFMLQLVTSALRVPQEQNGLGPHVPIQKKARVQVNCCELDKNVNRRRSANWHCLVLTTSGCDLRAHAEVPTA